MENIMRRGTADRKCSRQLIYEDLQPSCDWNQDQNCHFILIDIPGFKKEELKVEVDTFHKIAASGERKINENKFHRFKQVFEVPADSDISKVTARLEGGILFVIIPKKPENKEEDHDCTIPIERKKKYAAPDNNSGPSKDIMKKEMEWEKVCYSSNYKEKLDTFVENVMEMVIENKDVIITGALVLSAGLFLCHKLRSIRGA